MAFKILSTTDVHGNLLAYNFVNSDIANKGLSRFSTFLEEERKKGKVIYVDNGDINQGIAIPPKNMFASIIDNIFGGNVPKEDEE